MFLKKKEEKILRARQELLDEDERNNKFFYELMINGEVNDKEFRNIASKYTNLKYCNWSLNNLIKDLKALNNCFKNNAIFGMSIFEENTYENVKQLYLAIREDVKYLCENIDTIDDFRKYHEKVLNALLQMKNINFNLYFSNPSFALDSDMLSEIIEFKNYADILWTSLEENWDYLTFIRKINIYQAYNTLRSSAVLYHSKQKSEKEDKYLEENPAHIIEHNPGILNDNLFDQKTLLEAKKVMYEHAKEAKSDEEEQHIIEAIQATNLTLKRY